MFKDSEDNKYSKVIIEWTNGSSDIYEGDNLFVDRATQLIHYGDSYIEINPHYIRKITYIK